VAGGRKQTIVKVHKGRGEGGCNSGGGGRITAGWEVVSVRGGGGRWRVYFRIEGQL
jgi:hypothetical protein